MSIPLTSTPYPTNRMPTFSMMVAAYGLADPFAYQSQPVHHQTEPPAIVTAGQPVSRMLLPCEAPWCGRLTRALVCEFHRPRVLR